MASADSNSTRIVLVGNTGSGKSSLANTLFGEDVFPVNHSAKSGTKLCLSKTKTVNGRSLQLIDTPGFFDSDPRSSELSPELLECITECAPGPHAFLLVLKVEQYTELQQMASDLSMRYFSDKALSHTIVVFTHGDQLQEGKKIEDNVNEFQYPGTVVVGCGGRCHVIDNKFWNNSQDEYRNNQYQIEELLKTIDRTVSASEGGFYTNELLRGLDGSLEMKENELSLLENVEIGILLGALLGAVVEESRFLESMDFTAGAAEESAPWWSKLGVGLMIWWASFAEQSVPRWSGSARAGVVYLAGKASQKWSSPTAAVRDLTEFSKEVERLFVQLKKTKEAIEDFVDSDSDSE